MIIILFQIVTTVADITKEEDCKKIADETFKYFGRIDVLVSTLLQVNRKQPFIWDLVYAFMDV